jgi:hypothetical protein
MELGFIDGLSDPRRYRSVALGRMGSARKAAAVAHVETAREMLMSNSFEFCY